MRKAVVTVASALLVMAALVAGLGPVQKSLAGKGFDNTDLKGDYSWRQVKYPTPAFLPIRVYLFSADGAGNYTLLDTGTAGPFIVETGTYSVQPNGTGFLTPTNVVGASSDPFPPLGGYFVLHSRGAGADIMSNSSDGVSILAVLTKQ
jgi:hypothetical protein